MVRIRTVDTRTRQLILDDVRSCWVVQDPKTVIIDSGFPADRHELMEGLLQISLAPKDIDYVALTHLHFDHAGGAGFLARENPDLKVFIHAKGARHLINPTRLTESVRRAYGERFHLVGSPWPVAENQVHTIGTGDSIDLGCSQLEVYSTPGHAKHHVIFFDPVSESVFSGDAMGSQYPGLPNFVLSPPADYDRELSKSSIDLIRALNPRQINFTHCGQLCVRGKPHYFESLKSQHDLWNRTVTEILEDTNGLSDVAIFNEFIDRLPQLKCYPQQYFSFGLSVKGIRLSLKPSRFREPTCKRSFSVK
jgi:glyoxylase-like metal-dependent hydrolase (beta-lactamase superfamily II)